MSTVLHPSFKAMPHGEGLGTHNATYAPQNDPVAPGRCPAIGDVGAVQPEMDRGNVASSAPRLDADLLAKVAAIKARETAR